MLNEKQLQQKRKHKSETELVKTLDVLPFSVYREGVNVKHKTGRFVIPLEFKTNLSGAQSLFAKLVKIVEYNDEPSLETTRVYYSEKYIFIPVDEENDKEWLYVLSLEQKYKDHIKMRKQELETKEIKQLERKKRKEEKVANGEAKKRKKRITKKEEERQFLEKFKKRQQEQNTD